jgi:hypothetical protein
MVAMLVFPAMASAETLAPDGTTQASLPTIQSDKADYAPGSTVTLTGSGWQSGETVNIKVNDTYGATWSRNVDVTADASGNVTDSFNLPNTFVSDYDVTATGAQSGTATTTFTDAASLTLSPTSGPTGTAVTASTGGGEFSGNANNIGIYWNGAVNTTSGTLVATCSTNNGGNITGCIFNVPTAGAAVGSHTVVATEKSKTANSVDAAFNVTSSTQNTTTTVTSNNNPSTYGNSVTFTATVTGSSSNPSGVGNVTFKDGGTAISGCSNVALTGNTATCATTGLSAAASPHSITADYSGGTGYNASTTSSALSQAVNKRSVTASITAAPKVYDGTTAATITGCSLNSASGNVGVLAGDSSNLGCSGSNGAFADKNVGNGKTVSANVSLSGSAAGNYQLSSNTASTTANITAKGVTGSFTAGNKVYDGTTAATITGRSLSGVISPDAVTLTGGTATFNDKNVGNGKTVTLSGATLGGADAANYSLTSVGTTTSNITPKQLTGSFTAANKVVDGNTSATITGRSLSGVINPDAVTLTGGTATFDNANVGPNKTVTGTGFTLTGAGAGNYSLVSTTLTTTASILYAPATGTTCLGSPGHTILQPINPASGTDSVFKQGSTVPAKFRVCDASGNSIGTAGVATSFKQVKVINGTEATTVNEDVISTTPDTAFRWSATDQQWIFNINTKSLTANKTYVYQITLNDGTTIDFQFGLK